jgi:hypothetical protein
MNKKKFSLGVSLFALVGAMLVNGCTTNEEKGKAYVTIETNPSVELVVDEDGFVVAVNGLNEDGKLLMASEDLTGLSIEKAAKKVVELTEKLGFTVQGTIDEESQEISISVSATKESVQEGLTQTLQEEVNKVVTELNLDAKVTEVQAVTRENLEVIVLEQFPHLTEEEVKAMTVEELHSYLQAAVAEKALFASVKLEEYYQDLKEYEFKLAYKEELAKSLEKSESVVANAIYSTYNAIVNKLHETITKLQQTEVEFLTSPDSIYVKALNSLNSAKDEVIGIRVELGARETKGYVTEALISALTAAEATLNTCSEALTTVETAFKATVATAIAGIEAVLVSLEQVEKTFPSDIDFNAALTNAETYINDAKNGAMAKFEASFQEGDLAEIKTAIETRKASLQTLVDSKKQKVEQEAAQ